MVANNLSTYIVGFLEDYFQDTDLFLVDVKTSANDKIQVFVDRSSKNINIDTCAKISRFLEQQLEENGLVNERYKIDVSSPGMTNGFKVKQQYQKNLGRAVQVITTEFEEMNGILKAADEKQIVLDLVDSFSEFKEFKNIDRPTMMRVVEDVFRTLVKKKYGSDDNFDVIVNTDKGDLEIWRIREIVEDGEVEDDLAEISFTDSQKVDADYEIGEELYEEVQIMDFGRRAVLAARQTLVSRILDLEKDDIYKKYNLFG